ncbi:MAG: AAA family ATPase [Cognatishimia sp.]|uniref:AAA family ATPase n=1 Tax=Cognatishimia sp. TaxID=2211648 RepID=UPI003B8D4510
MITTLAISGYRSLRDLNLPLEQLNVVTGANGTGKSSLYRALRLLGEVAQGRAIASLAAEGGLSSTLWAGPETISRSMKAGEIPVTGTVRSDRVALKLGFSSEDYGYAVDLGLPIPSQTAFGRDPEIKAEGVWVGQVLNHHNALALRAGPGVRARDADGHWQQRATSLAPFDSMMTHVADPMGTPEMLHLRELMRSWRFYDNLRTDRDAPARGMQVGTRTPVLAADGADCAAAVQTILEIGDGPAFDEAIADAFDGASVGVEERDGMFSLTMQQTGLLRPLSAAELSDGTLRFILLATALLTPRPPTLMVLNEPETSLHPGLISPLARLIARVSEVTQIIVVSHSGPLVTAMQNEGAKSFELTKTLGETQCEAVEDSTWAWPKR